MMKKDKSFYLFFVDDDKKVFNIIGPIRDDRPWINKIIKLQQSGKNVRCFSASLDEPLQYLANSYSRQMEYEYLEELLFNEPEDKSNIYVGALPLYARNADRKRLVKIICRGICRMTRFGEMNKDYPGADVLKNAELEEFTARCLMCGYIAKDNYNWYR